MFVGLLQHVDHSNVSLIRNFPLISYVYHSDFHNDDVPPEGNTFPRDAWDSEWEIQLSIRSTTFDKVYTLSHRLCSGGTLTSSEIFLSCRRTNVLGMSSYNMTLPMWTWHTLWNRRRHQSSWRLCCFFHFQRITSRSIGTGLWSSHSLHWSTLLS